MLNHFDNKDFKLQNHHVEHFKQHGFVKLSKFLNDNAISFLQERAESEMQDSHFKDFVSRMRYELTQQKDKMYQLISQSFFQETLLTITGQELFFAFDMAVEIEKNKSSGFPWHVGTQTFAIQKLENFGCTIWIPLNSIYVEKQAGGMAYVSQSIICGKVIYEKIEPAIVSTLEKKEEKGVKTSLEDYYALRHGFLNSSAILDILETHKIEEDYEVGDVVLFNKNVIHRSSRLKDGPLAKRAAFILRFMGVDSRFNKQQALNIDYPARKYGATLFAQTHKQMNLEDGQLFIESSYFDNIDKRMIKKIHNLN
ncbi:hypothetical protein [Candidatus Tisiphia endosymbiont of Ptychoptera albimana]|uniref:hypothetical protein n=1 Tax=Candidatus Tisiphia endosymbiont of Ptychoptera albimana TaxID=3066260 RepID=UPI00312C894F